MWPRLKEFYHSLKARFGVFLTLIFLFIKYGGKILDAIGRGQVAHDMWNAFAKAKPWVRVSVAWIDPILLVVGMCLIIWAIRDLKEKSSKPPKSIEEQEASSDALEVQLIPSEGPSERMLLTGNNQGKIQKFHATCRLMDSRNDPNPLFKTTYDLLWDRSSLERQVTLVNGESCNLLIATAEENRAADLAEMKLWGLSGGERKSFWGARWGRWERHRLPEFDLEISVFGEGDQRRATKRFTLRPGTSSALAMVPLTSATQFAGEPTPEKILAPEAAETPISRPKVFLDLVIPDRIVAGPLARVFQLRNEENAATAFRVRAITDNSQEFWLRHDDVVSSIAPGGKVVFWCHAMRKQKGSADSYPLGGVPENRVETLLDAMIEAGVEPAISVTIEYEDFDRRPYKEVFRVSKDTLFGPIHIEHLPG